MYQEYLETTVYGGKSSGNIVGGYVSYCPLNPRLKTRVCARFCITLSGPAYQDNPILYANQTFRDMTGYPLGDLVGENPRLLQGPETEQAPVADLREALDIWEPVTVELTNYRNDGTPFRNRVSLVPLDDETGTITNWVGVQEVVDH